MHTGSIRGLVVLPLLGFAVLGCGPSDEAAKPVDTAGEVAVTAPPVIEVEATEYAFTGPPTFPSGWVTLRLTNTGEQPHFLLLWRLPGETTFDDWVEGIAPFGDLYVKYRAGELEQADFLDQLGASLPDFFFEAQRMGGPGFVAPGRSGETTVFLEPGEYVMECYVRDTEQPHKFHGDLGMLRPLIVEAEGSGASPPEADIGITLSNYQIQVEGETTAGRHTVRARVAEDPDGMIIHNVQLARLEDDSTGEEAARWLDWVDEMLPPAPVEFLGGAGQMMAGGEAYFTVDLEPGRYAWVSESWGTQGMMREFTVE